MLVVYLVLLVAFLASIFLSHAQEDTSKCGCASSSSCAGNQVSIPVANTTCGENDLFRFELFFCFLVFDGLILFLVCPTSFCFFFFF
jgi:hypothetical protein